MFHPFGLALPLFVSGIDTIDSHNALAPYHLAFAANLLYRGSDLHPISPYLGLPFSVDDSPSSQIVGGKLYFDFVSRKNLNIVHSHLA